MPIIRVRCAGVLRNRVAQLPGQTTRRIWETESWHKSRLRFTYKSGNVS